MRAIVNAVVVGLVCSPLLLFGQVDLLSRGDEAAVRREESFFTGRIAAGHDARTEVTLPDGSRADIVADGWAAEVEWADNWQEGPGQALLYAELTGRQPVLFLLVGRGARQQEKLYYLRCALVCRRAGITLRTHDVRE